MKKEQAEKIANQIYLLCETLAAIRINEFCESTEKAIHNTKIAEGLKTGLVNLLIENSHE